ncbi:MAG: hypothetical protein H0W44_01635 [Gammaproteobacteria bacterium]|nr:hypothetical protein [Gammaproteobacteria bacterium]
MSVDSSASYEIIDEPKRSLAARLVVDPLWPLLAVMFGGALISWAWFIYNSIALGSPRKRYEIGLLILAYIVFVMLVLLAAAALHFEWLSVSDLRYARLALTVVTLYVCYMVYLSQAQAFALFHYFSGQAMTGIPGLFLAYFIGRRLESVVIDSLINFGKHFLSQWYG